MINDFPINPLTNMPGLQAFSFSPLENISAQPAVKDGATTGPVTFKAGKDFYTGYAAMDSLQFDESGTDDDQGTVYSSQLTGYYSGDSAAVLDVFQSIKACKQMVVLAKDRNGLLRLVGWNAPLQFDYNYSTGKAPGSDARGYAFKFYGTGGRPSPVYMP